MAKKPEMIPPEDRPGFRGYDTVTWRDMNNREKRQYVAKANGNGGYKVVNTYNGVEEIVADNFSTMASAEAWMHKTKPAY